MERNSMLDISRSPSTIMQNEIVKNIHRQHLKREEGKISVLKNIATSSRR